MRDNYDSNGSPSAPLTLARVPLASSLRQAVRSRLGAPSLLLTYLVHLIHSPLSLAHNLLRVTICSIVGPLACKQGLQARSAHLIFLVDARHMTVNHVPTLASLSPATMLYLRISLCTSLTFRLAETMVKSPAPPSAHSYSTSRDAVTASFVIPNTV